MSHLSLPIQYPSLWVTQTRLHCPALGSGFPASVSSQTFLFLITTAPFFPILVSISGYPDPASHQQPSSTATSSRKPVSYVAWAALSSAGSSYCLWQLSVFTHVGAVNVYFSLPNLLGHILKDELFAAFSVLASTLSCTRKELGIYSYEVLNKLKNENWLAYPKWQFILLSRKSMLWFSTSPRVGYPTWPSPTIKAR